MIHPIPPLMGRSLLTGFQNLDRGLVGLQVPPDLGVGEQMLSENSQPVHRCGCPPVKGGSGNGDVFTQEALTLAREWKVIYVLVYQNARHQASSRNALIDHPLGKAANERPATRMLGFWGIFIADIPLDVKTGGF